MLASLILLIHLLVILFNLFGLVVIPLGAWRGWQFVYAPAWRLLHIASLGMTALQAAMGKACFLTIWELKLSADQDDPDPMIMKWINSLIYWPIPIWAFSIIYLLLFAYVVTLLWFVPIRRR